MRRSLVQKLPSPNSPVWFSTRRLTAIVSLLAVSSCLVLMIAHADTTPQTLPFSQN